MFPNRVPMDSDTTSPEPLVYFSFIHSCTTADVPNKQPSYIQMGKKHKVTFHEAPSRRKAYIQWAVVTIPKSIVTTLQSLTQCHAAFGTLPSTLAWVDQSPVNPYPTVFPYGNGMVLHFYQQQESSTTKTVHKVINKRLKTYV